MSYNGIGLSTARGSGTNGYVQRNMGSVRHRRHDPRAPDPKLDAPQVPRGPNKDILEHHQKRLIELRVVELEEQLEQQGLDENSIATRLTAFRAELKDQVAGGKQLTACDPQHDLETHAEAKLRDEKNTRMRNALRVDHGYTPGKAFNVEAIAMEKEARKLSQPQRPESKWLDRTVRRKDQFSSQQRRHGRSRSMSRSASRSPLHSRRSSQHRKRHSSRHHQRHRRRRSHSRSSSSGMKRSHRRTSPQSDRRPSRKRSRSPEPRPHIGATADLHQASASSQPLAKVYQAPASVYSNVTPNERSPVTKLAAPVPRMNRNLSGSSSPSGDTSDASSRERIRRRRRASSSSSSSSDSVD